MRDDLAWNTPRFENRFSKGPSLSEDRISLYEYDSPEVKDYEFKDNQKLSMHLSGMCTMKTKKLISFREKNPDLSILVISVRRTFANSVASDLVSAQVVHGAGRFYTPNERKFNNYLDEKFQKNRKRKTPSGEESSVFWEKGNWILLFEFLSLMLIMKTSTLFSI